METKARFGLKRTIEERELKRRELSLERASHELESGVAGLLKKTSRRPRCFVVLVCVL